MDINGKHRSTATLTQAKYLPVRLKRRFCDPRTGLDILEKQNLTVRSKNISPFRPPQSPVTKTSRLTPDTCTYLCMTYLFIFISNLGYIASNDSTINE